MARRRRKADEQCQPEPVPEVVAVEDEPASESAPAVEPAPVVLTPAIAGFHSRSEAGLGGPTRPFARLPRREGLVVHCTDGKRPKSPSDVPGILRAVNRYHQRGRGWTFAGYHFAVDPWGHVWEMRGWGVMGAHASTGGHNHKSHGVVLLGDGSEMTDPERAALLWIRADAERRFGPQWVKGHGSIPGVAKACPGPAVAAFVRGL